MTDERASSGDEGVSFEAVEDAAIEFALDLLEGFSETSQEAPVAVWLDVLSDEYHRAKTAGDGMSPDLVKLAVQKLIDAAEFLPDNRPDTYDPAAPTAEQRLEEPLFRFVRKRGRPSRVDNASRIAFVVGAVEERFALQRYRNPEPTQRRASRQGISAVEVVAMAQEKAGQLPSSYSGVRACIESEDSELSFAEGRLFGQAERKSSI